MVLSSAEITTWVGSYLWPLFRIAAMVAIAPIFGARFFPVRLKIVLIVALTILIAPLVGSVPQIDPISLGGMLIAVQQVLIGLVLGFAMNMVFSVFVVGGQIIALKMGLGFASMVDPQMGTQVPVVSQFYITIVSLVFLAFNGHLILIQVLADSFQTIPISTQGIERQGYWILVSWVSDMFAGAVMMALPAVASLLLVNMALGVIMRASPQFNIMAIGFPITLSLGFVIMLVTLPMLFPHITQFTAQGFALISRVLSGV